MAEKRTILVCSCEDTMPLDADAHRARLPRRGGEDRAPALPRRARALPRRRRQAASRSPSAAPRRRRCSPRSRRTSGGAISFVNRARDRRLVGRCRQGRAEDGGAARGRRRAAAGDSVRQLTSEGVMLIYGRDERAIEAGKLLKDHLDVTVLITRPDGAAAAARHRVPGGEGHDQVRQGPSRRVRDRGRRLCRAGAVLARRAGVRPGARRRGVALRSRARSVRRRAAVHRRRSARRLSARRSGRSGRGAARGAEGARSRRHLRQAALHHLHRGPLRAFALEDRRLPPLPRSLPDRRDRARRRSRRDRRAGLRRLRPMRRGLPDRRRGLCAAAGRRADAQAARAACDLSRGRRQPSRSFCCTTRSTAPR